MNVNKVFKGNELLLDVSQTTATEEDVLSGEIFVKADGSTAIGTMHLRNAQHGTSEPSSTYGSIGDLYYLDGTGITKASTPSSVISSTGITSIGAPLENVIGKSENNDTYAQVTPKAGAGAANSAYVYYGLDFTSVPKNAVVKNVTFKFSGSCSSINVAISTLHIYLYDGTTVLTDTDAGYIQLTSKTIKTITVDGSVITRDILDNLQILVVGTRAIGGTSHYVRFYGATVTVEYEYKGWLYKATSNGWENGSIYKKENGQWTKPTDQESILSEGENFIYKGEITDYNDLALLTMLNLDEGEGDEET